MTDSPKHPKDESVFGPTLTMVFIHALIPVGLGLFVLYRVPEYREIFEMAQVALPSISVMVLDFSKAARENAAAFFAIIGILLAADGLGYYLLRRFAERVWARLWWGAVFAIECLLLAGVFRAIVLPARTIAESASG